MSVFDFKHVTAQLSLPVAHLIATVSSSATMLAVMVTLAQGEAAARAVTAVLLCVAVPQILLAPLAAPLLDRFGPRKIVLASVALQIPLMLSAAMMPTTTVIVLIIAARSCVSALDSAALMLLADRGPRSDEKDSTARVFARLDTARLVGGFIGPLIGGIALAHVGLSWLFVAQATTILLLGVIASVYPQLPTEQPGPTASWWHRVREAPTMLFQHSAARGALTGLVLAIVFTSLFSTGQTLYAVNILQLTPIGVAVLTQCFIVGRLIGSRLGARIKDATASTWLLAATALMGLGLLLPGLVHSNIAAGAGFAVAGIANAVQVAAIRLIVVGAVPDETRGRALAAMGSVNQTAGVLGTALAAPALALTGPAGTLIIAGVGTLVAAGVTWILRSGASRRVKSGGVL